MAILEIDSVHLSFDKQEVLTSVYLKSETGFVTGILGSNGSGKSCLLKILFGTLNSQFKSIRIDSKAITKPLLTYGTVKYLPQFNFIPKRFSVSKAFKWFNVNEDVFYIHFPLLKVLRHQIISTLSGGERRIIETYLILKSPSKFVLLDEPFSHIAPVYIEKIKELIREEKAKKGIVITDHMYTHITELSDTIYLLKDTWVKEVKNLNELEFYRYANI